MCLGAACGCLERSARTVGNGVQHSGRNCRLAEVADVTSGLIRVTVKIEALGTIGAKFKVDPRRYRRQRTMFCTWNRSVRGIARCCVGVELPGGLFDECASLI